MSIEPAEVRNSCPVESTGHIGPMEVYSRRKFSQGELKEEVKGFCSCLGTYHGIRPSSIG